MSIRAFTADGFWNTGIPGYSDAGYRCMKYAGSLGGGTLSIHSLSTDVDQATGEAIETPLTDAKISAATIDDNGDPVQQITFSTTGTIIIKLSGSVGADVKVMVE